MYTYIYEKVLDQLKDNRLNNIHLLPYVPQILLTNIIDTYV